MLRAALLAAFLCAVMSPAFAQTGKADPNRVIYPRNTVISLDGQVIEGAVEGPRGSTIFVRQPTRFSTCIQVRKSFRVELLSSSADL